MRIFVALVVLSTAAYADEPIPWTMKGSVGGGVFYAIDRGGAVRVRSAVDVSKLDGKLIARVIALAGECWGIRRARDEQDRPDPTLAFPRPR